MAYARRYVGGFVDKPTLTTPIDSTFLNAVEVALLKLYTLDPTDGQIMAWVAANSRFEPTLLKNANIDPAAAIAKSKLAALGIVDADVAGAAAIAQSKLALAITNAQIDAAAAIDPSKILGGGGLAGMFSAYRGGSDYTHTNGAAAWQAVVFNTEDFDLSGWFDAATGAFNPQVAGYYMLSGQVWYKTPMADGERIGVAVFKNGAQHKTLYFGHQSGTDSDTNRIGGSCIVHANGTTDTFTLQAYNNHGSSILIGANAPTDTWFQGHLIARG